MQPTFPLIDLLSQRHAVRRYLRDLDPDSKLKWIAAYGVVRAIDCPGFRVTYVFESRFGFTASFFFDEEGDFVFLGDHQTFK